MKDPCDTCLVKVTCGKICEKKESYTNIIIIAVNQFRKALSNNPNVKQYKKDYNRYYKLQCENIRSNIAIESRSMSGSI